MPVAVGVRHLGDHGAQMTEVVVGEPEADRVEDVAQKPRLREQQHAGRRQGRAPPAPHAPRAHPCPAPGAPPWSASWSDIRLATVATKEARALALFGVKQHVVDGVAEGVLDRALAAVEGFRPGSAGPRIRRPCGSARGVRPSPPPRRPPRRSRLRESRCFIQAPQNQVFRVPFIARIRSCAARAATSKTGWWKVVTSWISSSRIGRVVFSVTNSGSSCGIGCSEFIQ